MFNVSKALFNPKVNCSTTPHFFSLFVTGAEIAEAAGVADAGATSDAAATDDEGTAALEFSVA